MLTLTNIIILAVIQGLAELLPVSSSAHVIVAEKLLHIPPSSPQATIMLAMLHTGTMFAVIVYFWNAWKKAFFGSAEAFTRFATKVAIATIITGIIGYGFKTVIEKHQELPYSKLTSESLVEIGAHRPVSASASSLLTHIASIRTQQIPMFTTGEILKLQAKKGGQELPEKIFMVTPVATLGDLLEFYDKTLELPVQGIGVKSPSAGAHLEPNKDSIWAVRIEIIGNVGHENALAVKNISLLGKDDDVRVHFADTGKGEVEQLFSQMDLIAAALAAAGVLILIAGIYSKSRGARNTITTGDSIAIGAIQGLCLPFRGFSRSGATISVGLLRGVSRQLLEEYSFALAVVLTPAVVYHEASRLIADGKVADAAVKLEDFIPSLLGMVLSFLAGLIALKILSRILEGGQWWIFGVYCLAGSGAVYWMYLHGF